MRHLSVGLTSGVLSSSGVHICETVAANEGGVQLVSAQAAPAFIFTLMYAPDRRNLGRLEAHQDEALTNFGTCSKR